MSAESKWPNLCICVRAVWQAWAPAHFVISLLQHFHLTFSVRVFYYDILVHFSQYACKSKGKLFPYSLPSVGPGADPGVQAVSPQVT